MPSVTGYPAISRDPSLPTAISSNTITRLANTTAYSAGQLIGGSASTGFDGGGTSLNGFTFSSFARFASVADQTAMVRLDRARLYKSQANLLGAFELRIYRAKPTISVADAGSAASGVPVGSASVSARLIARFAFDFTTAVQGSDGSELAVTTLTTVPALGSMPIGATDLFGILVATGSYTPTSGETFSVVLEGLTF
jgi:hypothetical protein